MTKTTTYTWQGKVFDTEAKAQEEASSSVSKIQKDFSNTCSVIAVETDIKKYSAFIISQANRLTSHPKDLSDDDPRKFSFYCQGSDNHLPVSALKVKTLHREEFDNYINKKNTKKYISNSFANSKR